MGKAPLITTVLKESVLVGLNTLVHERTCMNNSRSCDNLKILIVGSQTVKPCNAVIKYSQCWR